MPTRKSSPTKAKRSPSKKRATSRSRSRSKTRKTTRSRSRSASRKTVTVSEVRISKSPARPAKSSSSPGRPAKSSSLARPPVESKVTSASSVQREEIVLPTRTSKRILEKTTYQVTKTSVAAKGDVPKAQSAAGQSAGGGLGYAGILVIIFTSGISILLGLACTGKEHCTLLKLPKVPSSWEAFIDWRVILFLMLYHTVIALLAAVPVGTVIQGTPLKDGSRLNYRCNGWLTLLVAAGAFGYTAQSGWPVKMTYFHDHYLQFLSADIILALVSGVELFLMAWKVQINERSSSADGTFWNDFVMGRALHPRFLGLDIKQVLVRAMQVAWVAIDWMYVMDRFKKTQNVEPALAVVVLCHTLFVLFLFKNETILFASSDFVTQGGGYLICWSCMGFFPYLCTLQTRYLYLHPNEGLTNKYALGAVFLLHVAGLMFFVGANRQKNEFRSNPYSPELAHLSSIPTSTGKRLLCSGWWGIVRRPNYLGDLMMTVAWSIACGFSSGIPHVYLVYLVIILMTRVISDEKSCHKRYGDAWIKYTEAVPYRLIPYVF